MLRRKALYTYTCLAAGLVLGGSLLACSDPGKGSSAASTGSGQVEFTAGSDKVSTRVWTFHRFTGAGDYNFTSSMHADKRTLGLNFRDPGVGKTIHFGGISSGNYGSYTEVFGDPKTVWNITSGSMRFTEFDTDKKKVSASFELVAESADNRTLNVVGTITAGEIGADQLLY